MRDDDGELVLGYESFQDVIKEVQTSQYYVHLEPLARQIDAQMVVNGRNVIEALAVINTLYAQVWALALSVMPEDFGRELYEHLSRQLGEKVIAFAHAGAAREDAARSPH